MGRSKALNTKAYIKASEWKNDFGGYKGDRRADPVCTPDGHIFDKQNLLEWLQQHHNNPVTGEPLDLKDIIPLIFHKNAEGQFHCPVTYKIFTPHTHIVAVRTSGHVYSYEAIRQLNIEPQHWKCLLSGIDFTREDIIHLQDPHNLEHRNAQLFECHRKAPEPTSGPAIAAEPTTQRVLSLLEKEREKADSLLNEKRRLDRAIAAMEEKERSASAVEYVSKGTVAYDKGPSMVAASFTSTALTPTLSAPRTARIVEVTEKGYVRLDTTHGPLNIELHCDLVPKTCENFLLLCERSAYDGVIFHRVIKGFMAQGGDPTGTGRGGQSAWSTPFKDEFHRTLSHNARGIVSMANSFITFAECKQLDRKHSIFGRLVGGLATLDKIEAERTNEQDRPINPVIITKATVLVDPFRALREGPAPAPAAPGTADRLRVLRERHAPFSMLAAQAAEDAAAAADEDDKSSTAASGRGGARQGGGRSGALAMVAALDSADALDDWDETVGGWFGAPAKGPAAAVGSSTLPPQGAAAAASSTVSSSSSSASTSSKTVSPASASASSSTGGIDDIGKYLGTALAQRGETGGKKVGVHKMRQWLSV